MTYLPQIPTPKKTRSFHPPSTINAAGSSKINTIPPYHTDSIPPSSKKAAAKQSTPCKNCSNQITESSAIEHGSRYLTESKNCMRRRRRRRTGSGGGGEEGEGGRCVYSLRWGVSCEIEIGREVNVINTFGEGVAVVMC